MSHELRIRVWNNIGSLKFKCIYIEKLIEKYQKRNTAIKTFLTLASLSSVSAWIIWEKLPFLWAAIIATAQVLNALKPIFKFEEKITHLIEFRTKLYDIEVEFERLFYDIDFNDINSTDIKDRFFKNYENAIKAEKPLPNQYYKVDKRLSLKAQVQMEIYLNHNYPQNQ